MFYLVRFVGWVLVDVCSVLIKKPHPPHHFEGKLPEKQMICVWPYSCFVLQCSLVPGPPLTRKGDKTDYR